MVKFLESFSIDQPTAQVIPGNVTVNQSDTITLTCLTSGNPAPTVTWTTDGNQSVILSSDNKLELVITSKTNEGRYRCTVANGIGLPGTSTAYVFVKREYPSVRLASLFFLCYPQWKIENIQSKRFIPRLIQLRVLIIALL